MTASAPYGGHPAQQMTPPHSFTIGSVASASLPQSNSSSGLHELRGYGLGWSAVGTAIRLARVGEGMYINVAMNANGQFSLISKCQCPRIMRPSRKPSSARSLKKRWKAPPPICVSPRPSALAHWRPSMKDAAINRRARLSSPT